MEASQIHILKIDKSSWVPVKFGDVVTEPRGTVKDIESEGIKHVVGLEHIETGNIHLRNSAGIEESTTFSKKFEKGDVLFGRRRAYLKKAAQASFSGICSGDITVLRAKQGLLPELLPFVVNNDKFFDHAIKHSAGGLSPRVKFKDLANYVFLLPPKDQQAQLAVLLWAMDEVIDTKRVVLERVHELMFSLCLSYFLNGEKTNRVEKIELPNSDWKLVPLKSVVPDIEYGISISIPDNQVENGMPIISTAEIDREGNLDYSIIRKIKYDNLNSRLTLQSGDILFNWRNSVELVGKTAIFNQPEMTNISYSFASFILRLRCDEQIIHNKFLMFLLNFYRKIGIFLGLARKAVNQANFNKNELGDLLIPLPPYCEQLKIMNKLNESEDNKSFLQKQLAHSKALQKSIINQIF
ncbi:MAG: restriction endonuclease subunit S [Bacteroidetes bacterium]|nr:restriction endonuclease subunit S [Bacteroidota bacterium]